MFGGRPVAADGVLSSVSLLAITSLLFTVPAPFESLLHLLSLAETFDIVAMIRYKRPENSIWTANNRCGRQLVRARRDL